MAMDSQAIQQPAPQRDLRRLPEIVAAKAVKVTYRKPLIRYQGTRRVEYKQAIEIIVETAFELPAQAVTPALYVGETEITEYEMAGKNRYRFFAFDLDSIREGAPLRLDWPRGRGGRPKQPMLLKLSGEEKR